METITSFKAKQSTGLDVINSGLHKRITAVIAQSLSVLINKSLEPGIFNYRIKIATVILIRKDKSKSLAGTNRPISFLSVISKIYEKKLLH